MPANYLYPAGEPAPQPIVNETINKTINKTVNVFQPKPERDVIDDIGRVADTARKVYEATKDFSPFSHLIPFLPVGGMGQNNPGAGEFPEPFEPPIIPEIPIIPI